jgi:hypothetical protein
MGWFDQAKIILFLNKNDLFKEKIKTVDIGLYHEDYKDGCNYDKGLAWVKQVYQDRLEDQTKEIYVHVTDATNTENIAFVWKAAKHIIMQNKMSGLSLV